MPTATLDPATDKALAEQLYDVLMGEIEPDLLLGNIPGLDAKYAGETPEQKDARMKRYEESYKKFDLEFSKFMVDVNDELKTARRAALQEKEEEDRTQESTKLGSLEAAFR